MPGSSSPKATRPPTSRRKPPPIWQETITTNADAPVTRLLWISRERFVELVGHLPEVHPQQSSCPQHRALEPAAVRACVALLWLLMTALRASRFTGAAAQCDRARAR
jgi:hypothetical protein